MTVDDFFTQAQTKSWVTKSKRTGGTKGKVSGCYTCYVVGPQRRTFSDRILLFVGVRHEISRYWFCCSIIYTESFSQHAVV
jgi:hypothetical protein